MAIYHLHTKAISRSAGRSAIACAAYRSGEKLYSEETDRTFDYTNKGGVVHSEIALCANAPERFSDRQTLWNSVQSVENKADSRLARDFDMALPNELSLEENIAIGREFAAYMAAQGMIFDWAIHDPVNKETGTKDNIHMHGMATTRPIKENGEWGSKEKKIYKLDENGERIPVIDPKTGKQKIGAKNRKMWQRETVEATGWDSKEKLVEWREQWAAIVNKHIDLHKQMHPEQEIDHIDHRSYAERGIDLVPTVHEGYAAREMDKQLMEEKGEHAELVQLNIDIKERNKLVSLMKQVGHEIVEKARAIYDRFRKYTEFRGTYQPAGRSLKPVTDGKLGVAGLEQSLERRERETPEIVERIRDLRKRAVKKKEIAEAAKTPEPIPEPKKPEEPKYKVIPAKYAISGSNGSNYNAIYKSIGEGLINNNGLKALSYFESSKMFGRTQYDGRYNGEVFIIKPSYLKKAEKLLEKRGIEYAAVPIKYGKADMIALVCNERGRDFCEDNLKYHDNFFLYIDYTPAQKVRIDPPKPSIVQKVRNYNDLVKGLEKEARAPAVPEKMSMHERLKLAEAEAKERNAASQAKKQEEPEQEYQGPTLGF